MKHACARHRRARTNAGMRGGAVAGAAAIAGGQDRQTANTRDLLAEHSGGGCQSENRVALKFAAGGGHGRQYEVCRLDR